jgi:hypothetical protein
MTHTSIVDVQFNAETEKVKLILNGGREVRVLLQL